VPRVCAVTGWDDAVPMVPRRHAGLPRYLDQASFVRLLASLNTTSPRGLRDRAIILCIARLGLRASEVVELELDDVDRRNGTMRVRRRKTGHGALLPLPQQVGAALTDDLRHGPPGYSIAAGVRAAPAAGRGANQHPYRGPRGGARAGPGRDRRPGTRLIGHYSDLRLGRRAAAGRVALAGDFRTGHVVELVEDYLTLRHDLGYHSPGQDSYLRCFAAWLDRAGHRGPIPLAATIGWATATRSPDPCNPARRLATVRGFLRHLAGIDAATEVPPTGFLGPVGQRKPPHICTDAEIADLLRAAGGPARIWPR